MSQTAPEPTDGYRFFERKVREVVGLDLSSYRSEQMERRLRGLAARHPGETFFSLGRRLERDAGFARGVADFLTINVSEFFRNPERFAYLEQHVLPGLRSRPRVWSAGCSIGAEPYSLAISLLERSPGGGSILATDVDPTVLERARQAVYYAAELRSVEPGRLRRHFEPVSGGFRVRESVRRLVRFQVHNLLEDPFPGGLDLIVCRNVVIYFTEAAKADLYRRFRDALRPGGVLFVGATESIMDPRALGLGLVGPFFYRRTDREGPLCGASA